MYVCKNCEQPINSASALCPYCGASQSEPGAGEAPKPAKKRSAARLPIAIAIVVLGIWGIIWFALPLRFQNPRPAAEKSAITSLRAVQKDLAAYQNGAGSFPPTLEALGEPAVQAAQEAMSGGYALRYAPGQIDADGGAHGYSLLAVPRNYGYRSFYTDQTGVVRATRDSRPATAQDPVAGTQ
ncbi:MAG TPA: zinc ribbon domain-containing protein [Candidatus Acidoferrales bacterium]|nr:zinc ribbon domain-containing protein [Candidatus Acidoferrales bacterium]